MCCRIQCSTKKHSKCSDSGSAHQPFPDKGPLACDNQRNLPCDKLRNIADEDNPDVYLYIIATIEYQDQKFLQRGTGPNFQGDLITLCTCKHDMRSSMDVGEWSGKWIAGFTGRMELQAQEKKNYLVYLMKVSEAFESFHKLWNNNIPDETKKAKAAHLCKWGDIYEPKRKGIDPYEAKDYVYPCGQYDRAICWRKDIKYYSERFKRRAALLVGDERKSFLWDGPMIKYQELLPRGYKKVKFKDFLRKLEI